MSNKRLSRRTILRGALASGAGVSVSLPILDIMLNGNGTAFAQGMPLPKRYCTWFFGNGIIPTLWNPTATGTGSSWSLSPELAPLAAVKPWLTVVSGLKNMVGNASPHPMGSAASTTGGSVANNSAELASIDQIVAGVNKGGSFPSLEIGCSDATPNGPENTLHTCSHRGPNAPNYPEFDPHAAFTRMFMGVSTKGTVDQTMKLNQAKKSILDAVLADGAEVNALLGAKDKARLADHLDAIRQIEARLATMTTPPSTIQIPPDPQTSGITKDTKSEAPLKVNDVMAQMLAVALASGITNNATFMFTLPAAHVYYRSVGTDMNADFHDTIAHTDAGNNDATNYQTRYHKGVLYAMQGLNTFASQLSKMTEGAGTVLDNMLIYVTSCTGWGKVHDTSEWPVLYLGKAGGALKGDQHFRAPNGNLSSALLTVANIFGAGLKSIGKGNGLTSTELTGLRVG
ncbi:MAG TPA: DUF1552 domain-containing protein [Polyangia bacterium]|nr:DUF1552 domain-containing protein [Polyangia bacterium]